MSRESLINVRSQSLTSLPERVIVLLESVDSRNRDGARLEPRHPQIPIRIQVRPNGQGGAASMMNQSHVQSKPVSRTGVIRQFRGEFVLIFRSVSGICHELHELHERSAGLTSARSTWAALCAVSVLAWIPRESALKRKMCRSSRPRVFCGQLVELAVLWMLLRLPAEDYHRNAITG